MRLFQSLFRRKHMPNGHIWRGKDRLTKEVTTEHVQKLRNQFEIEERNMFLLRHSYLTPEQSYGHAKALGKNEANTYKTIIAPKKEFVANVKIEDKLGHLRFNESWE